MRPESFCVLKVEIIGRAPVDLRKWDPLSTSQASVRMVVWTRPQGTDCWIVVGEPTGPQRCSILGQSWKQFATEEN
jgi:hypothetical protein